MKTEQNFYDILQSKFSGQQVPFQEQDWKAMRQMIDASRATKRRVIWLVASVSLLIIAGGTFALVALNSNKGAVSQSVNSSYTTGNTTIVSSGDANNLKTTATIPEKSVNKTTSSAGNQLNTITANNSTKDGFDNKQNNSRPAVTNNVKTVEGSHTHTVNTKGSNGYDVATASVNSVSSATKGKDASASNSDAQLSATPNTITSATNSSSKSANNITASTAKTTVHKTDSISAGSSLPQRFSDEPRVFSGKTNLVSIDASGQYSFGWLNGPVTQGKGLSYSIGLGYEHYMGSKIFLKTGLLFSTYGNMSPGTYNYQHNIGQVIYDSVITTKRLYFLQIPLQAEYFFGHKKRSSIGLGGSVWILMGSSGYATTYQEADNNPPTNRVKYSQNIELNGYSKVDFSTHAFYRYIFSRKLSMYITVFQEWTSIRNSAFFGQSIIDRTKGIQYTLSYNLN